MYSSESYAGGGQSLPPVPVNSTLPINLVIVDGNGNMSTQIVTPPSLSPIPPSSNIVCTDRNGNISVMSPAAVYANPANPFLRMINGLLTIDATGNFVPVTTTRFNPCQAYSYSDSAYTMHGIPGSDTDGNPTCSCTLGTYWDGHAPGNGCSLCDGTPTGPAAGQFGNFAGSNCQYSKANCSDHGKVNSSGGCQCDAGYVGSTCQYGPEYCNNKGVVAVDGAGNPYCQSCRDGYDPATQCKNLLCTYVSYPNEQLCTIYDNNNKNLHTTMNCTDVSGNLSPSGTVFYGDYTCKTINGFQQCGYDNAKPAPKDSAGNHDNQYAYGCPVLPKPVWDCDSMSGVCTRR